MLGPRVGEIRMIRPMQMAAVCLSAVLVAPWTRSAELPLVPELRAEIAAPVVHASVYEPHLSTGGRRVVVEYVGFPAVDVLAHVFGEGWSDLGTTVEFRALDGYVSRIDVGRFLTESAFLVFAKTDGSSFTIDNLLQNESDIPLGPYYLVWDNVANPSLLAEGGRNWPYQVTDINLVTLSDAMLVPEGLDERLHAGAELAKEYCLSCHQVNGFGGNKFPGNLAEIVRGFPREDFVQLVLQPSSVRSDATMPALARTLPEAERRHMAGVLFDYLSAVPVLE